MEWEVTNGGEIASSLAVQTAKSYIENNFKEVNKDKESMRFACMGLLEEAGEVVAELRKPLYKGNFHEKALNKKAITSELGDVMWYIALTCRNKK